MPENVDQKPVYVTPAVQVLGTVTKATLGSAGNNNADDTQYFE
ncbi:hypothetical protein [Streptomyces sp. NBC_01233]|nr:hypothetical protein OG332_14585 [Streptomyces sp. NBC_01233]